MTAYSNENANVPSPENFEVHHDLTKRIVIKPEDYSWTSTPIFSLEQVILEQIGGVRPCATTIARYTTSGEYPWRVPHGGEEILVLDGTLANEHGEYSTGSYVRNQEGAHSTWRVGANGSTLFVKSHRFAKNDKRHTVLDTNKANWHPGVVKGLQVMPLHEYEGEHIALVRWAPHTQFNLHSHRGGEEILVLEGVLYDEYDRYPAGTWIRSPHLSTHTPFTKEEGALIFVKTGHLSLSTA